MIGTNLTEYGVTSVSMLGLSLLFIAVLFVLFANRKKAIFSIIAFVCFVPIAQRLVLAGIDFSFLRILVLAGLMRVLIRGEYSSVKFNNLDYISMALAMASVVFFTMGQLSVSVFIYKLGNALDSLGLYLLFRALFRSWDDVYYVVRSLVLISFPVALFFLYEWKTGHNLFSILGGVPERTYARDGMLRCQGAFNHPITAGVFWGTLIPICFAYRYMGSKFVANLSILFISITVVTTATSTGLMAIMMALIGVLFVCFRGAIKVILISLVPILIFLHLVMNGPVWSLLAKVNILSSSTGWQRYYLIDMAIEHFSDWWMFGTPSTAYWGWGLWDITNEYIWQGAQGGLASMLLFVALLVVAFRAVHEVVDKFDEKNVKFAVVWAFGATLFSFTVTFFSISAYGQILFSLTLMLALIASTLEKERAIENEK